MKKGIKALKILGLCGLAFCGVTGGLATTYFLVPNRTETIDLGGEEAQSSGLIPTYFAKFVEKMAPIADGGLEDPLKLRADLDNVMIYWPDNKVIVDGELCLNMTCLEDIQATLDLDVNYNNKDIDLGVGYVDETIYLATKDLSLKADIGEDENNAEFLNLIDRFNYLFLDQSNDEGMRFTINSTENFIDMLVNFITEGVLPKVTMQRPGAVANNLYGNDVNAVDDLGDISKLLGDMKISETVNGKEATTVLSIKFDNERTGNSKIVNLKLVLDTDTLAIKKIDLGKLMFGDVVITGVLNCEMNNTVEVYPMDSEHYTYKNHGKFQSIFGYGAWLDDIFTLMNTRTVGLDVSASFAEDGKSIAVIEGNVDVDASRFEMINLIDTVFEIAYEEGQIDEKELEDGETFANKAIKRINTEKIHGSVDEVVNILNDFDLNLKLTLKNYETTEENELTLTELSNFNLSYLENNDGEHAGYLALNEFEDDYVMKAKIDLETVNYLIDKIPEIIDLVEGNDQLTAKNKTRVSKGLFDKVTSNEFIDAINSGDYSGIIELIKDLRTTDNTIELVVDASPFGLGDNATVKLVFNCLKEVDTPKVINITVSNVKLGAVTINATLNTRKFNKVPFDEVLSNESSYDRIDFLKGIADQATTILGNKQANVGIKGSFLDEEQLGFDFDGWTQFDYGADKGFGSIIFNQYKTSHDNPLTPHKVDISINNFGKDHSKTKMFFEYREKLCGTFTLKTFDDIIVLFDELMNNHNSRFYKLVSPLLSDNILSLIGGYVEEYENPEPEPVDPEKEVFSLTEYIPYIEYTKSNYIKEIKQTVSGNESVLDIVITKDLLTFLESGDLHVQLTFRNRADGTRELNSIKVIDLAVDGKKVNAEITVNEYDENIQDPVEVEKTDKFLDFSDIAILLELGINTIEYDYYHVSATANVVLELFGLDLISVTAKVDIHIRIDGPTFKMYGKVTNPVTLLEKGYCEFTYISDPSTPKLADGIIDILYTDQGKYLWDKKYQNFYRAESQFFFDNAVGYILNCMFDLDEGLTKDLISSSSGGGSGSENADDPKYENLFLENGFKYSYNESNGTHRWDFGVNIAAIAAKDTIGDLTGYISGLDVNRKIGNNVYTTRVLTKIHAETEIGDVLPIKIDLEFLNPTNADPSWDSTTESRFNFINGIYNKLPDNAKIEAFNNLSGYWERNTSIDDNYK